MTTHWTTRTTGSAPCLARVGAATTAALVGVSLLALPAVAAPSTVQNETAQTAAQSTSQNTQSAAGLTVTAANGGRGQDPAAVRLTVAGTGYQPGEALTVTVDGQATSWSAPPTVGSDGTFSGQISYAPAALRAGEHAVEVTGAQTAVQSTTVQVSPALTWTNLTLDSDGQLSVKNLPAGSVISAVELTGVRFNLSAPVAADATGSATINYSIPATAPLGAAEAKITQQNPAANYTAAVKISPSAATFGEDLFTRTQTPDAIEQGLYQSAYSSTSDTVFVTTASFTTTSRLYAVNPRNLKVRNSVVPPYVDGNAGPLWAAYGVGVDDTNGTVWVTNTRQDTVAVYDQDNLKLVKQFPAGTVNHSRDVLHDPSSNRIFVSSASEGYLSVFDATTLDKLADVDTGDGFTAMSLALDPATSTLYTVNLNGPQALAVDTKTLATRHLPLELPTGARASGVAFDPKSKRLFVASQATDNLLIADAATGATIKHVPTGAGALNVEFDPVHRLLYVPNFGGTTLSVADIDGNLVANLPFSRANHIETDGKGSVFAVNKAAENTVIKLTPKAIASSTPAVDGVAQVGKRLTARPGTWAPGASLSYQWQRDGVDIAGATARRYDITAADRGRRLTVAVTGKVEGQFSATQTSAPTAAVRAGRLTAPRPRVQGATTVGSTLSVRTGAWTPGSTLAYQWYADGKALNRQTGPTLTLTQRHLGKRLTVAVTGKQDGYQSTSVLSPSTGKVRG